MSEDRAPRTPTNDADGTFDEVDVAVVGGGLAGLTAGIYAARGGATVRRFEARRATGGRARTDLVEGCSLDHGPHALYRAGATRVVMQDLGIEVTGGRPHLRGGGWFLGGRWVGNRRLGPIGGLRGLAAMRRGLRRGEPARWRGRSMGEWLAAQPEAARPGFASLIRLSTYVADLDGFDAEAGLTQLARAVKQVDYLDGGWQQLVDGFTAAADAAGVVGVQQKVVAVTRDGERWRVETADGSVVRATAVVLAHGGAADADRLLGGGSPIVARWAAAARPVVAHCLAAVIDGPAPRRLGGYGLDEPVYSVDQSRSAKVAPAGRHVVQGLVYEPDRFDADPKERLEATLEVWWPGWRDQVVDLVERKRMVVAHDRPQPGVAAPTAAIEDLDGIWFASDAVTAEGLLADAAVSSARVAGTAAAAHAATAVRGSAAAPIVQQAG